MKRLAIGFSVLVFAGCQAKPTEPPAPPPSTAAVPEKRDDLAALLRKADALVPEQDESEKAAPPIATASADVTAAPERVDPVQRSVPVRSTVATSGNARATSAPQSSMDTMRADAGREFLPLLRSLSQRREKFETDYQRYYRGCSGPDNFVAPVPSGGMSLDSILAGGDDALIPPGRIPPPGPTTVDPSTVDRARTPLCRTLLQDIRLQRLQIRSDVNGMRETARRRGFWPGIMRELFGQYGLTY
jgi:hypothetical protein